MAIKKPAATKKAVSLNFNDMSQGLLDDFSGEITGADFRVHVYKEGSPEALVMALTVQTDEGNDHTEFFSLGKAAMDHFRPSKDGVNPTDDEGDIEDMRGGYIVPISDRAKLSGSTAFGVFMREAGREEFGLEITEDIGSLVGTYAHFNRLEQPPLKGTGIVAPADGKPQQPWRVLCITDIPKRDTKAAAKSTAKAGAKKAAPDEDEDDDSVLRERLAEAIVEALDSAKNKTLNKVKIANLAIKLTDDKAEKKLLVALAGDDEFLAGIEGAEFDSEEGTLTAS